MSELTAMFERQAAWQRSRAALSWTEKLRLALELRKAALALRATARPAMGGVAEGRTACDVRERGHPCS
jgi:hypothetical protein